MIRTTSALAVLAAASIALTACGGGSESAEAGGAAAAPDQSTRCTEDKVGGTIDIGEYAMLPTFAPGQGQFGVRGASESAAIFDRLMRWNPDTAEFEPKLAESLEANGDNTVWTLRLRDGVTFSNGDPLTADDVAFTMDLHKDPAIRSNALSNAMDIHQTRVVDPLTVEFTLADPWAGFPLLLAGTAGEVLPRDAYEAASPEEWARNPIGAGAFTMADYTPDQEVVLEPNPDYYGGPVCPTLRFTRIPGSQGTYEAFQTGELQVAFLRGAKTVTEAQDAGEKGYETILSAGSIVNLNTGAAGYDGPLTDERARQAFAHALDRDLIDQRLTGGAGMPASSLIAESSRFYDGQTGPEFDPELAASLVEEVKSDRPDWDGSITLLVADSPENMESGVALKALLDAVGFKVTIESAPVTQVVGRQFNNDFEAVVGGLAPSDADPASTFEGAMTPGASLNLSGIDDPELAAAAKAFKTAPDMESQKEALAALHEEYNRAVPFAVFAHSEEYVVVDDSVKGVTPTLFATMMYDGAFIEQ
ncbi:ABC transporter substrate-binding protein [Dietzia kunjamensis]|uniref:ABC transporter substrate-binding protein n=1 Tax=Dietzia kunjamensis TaxID=322509 RepID=UPI002DBFB7EC|nr:ABC transporter substrate-binding protein [Dietzia kunjamensis]MEB8327249.1 ABC transporter substrate-binding protein [Dietzia kunjamensis]